MSGTRPGRPLTTLHRVPESALALLLLVLVLSCSDARAWAPPYPIIDSTEGASLGLFIASREDASGTLTVDDVAHLSPDAFAVSETDTLHFGFTRSAWWFRIALQNTRDADETLLLDIPHPSLSHIDFYRPVGDGWAVTRSGTATERVVGDFENQNYLFGVTVPAGETRAYLFRVQSDLAVDFSIESERPENFSRAQSFTQIATGVALGVLMALTLFSVVAFGGVPRRAHLWYALFITSMIAFLLARLGYIGVLYFRGPNVQIVVETVAALAGSTAAVQFARVFLDSARFHPHADTWLGYFIVAGIVCLLATPLFDTWQYGSVYATFAALSVPATVVVGFMSWRKGCPDAARYLAGRLFAGVLGSIALGNDFAVFTTPFSTVDLLLTGACCESAILGWALYVRQTRTLREESETRLNDAITQAQTDARNEFLTRFSHDIRTPLNGILGMSELLADTTMTPRQREYTQAVRTSGEQLLAQLDEALDWARMEAGQLELQRAVFDLPELIADSIATIQQRAEEKHLELIVDLDPALPAHVTGDPARLRQVVCILLGNAVRYTHRGEIQVSATPEPGGDKVRIEVRDTGIGVPRERLATLLDPKLADDGTRGFGLVIARRLAECMGGTLGVQSEEHRGSLFWISIPLPAAPEQTPAPNADVLRGRRLLMVDDNAATRRVVETQGTGWGMQVTTAESGSDALAMARMQANLGTPFDAVIVDHNMPGMSGLQLAARIKEDPLIRHDAVIVMLTGLNIAPTEAMARNVGIRRVLTKPVAGRVLRDVLAEEIVRQDRFVPDASAAGSALPEGLRVLVVEDNTLSQKVMRGMLAKVGVGSDIVSNGQEAVEAIQHQRYDIVLMDCEMPVLDGYEATKRIRAWEKDNAKRPVPIIALSAHILAGIKERCRLAGMDAHMAKPVDLNELRDTLRVYGAR